jgi:hypothetical protein
MIQAGDGASFALKPLAQFGSVGKMEWQYLDGDNAIKTGVSGFINLAHAARTDSGENFVRP